MRKQLATAAASGNNPAAGRTRSMDSGGRRRTSLFPESQPQPPVPHPQPELGQPRQLRSPAAANKRSRRGGWEADGFVLLFCNFLFMKMLGEPGCGSRFAAQYLLASVPASPERELQALGLMDWQREMYGFPVASVSASLYLVPRGYFTAPQPSVNLC